MNRVRLYFLLFLLTTSRNSVKGKEDLEALTEVSKCCPLGETLDDTGRECVNSTLLFEPTFHGKVRPPSAIELVIGLDCQYGRYRLEPFVDSNDEFKLVTNGSLYVPYHPVQILANNEYCLESFLTSAGEVMVLPLVCFSPLPPEQSWKETAMILYSICCLISVPFLLLTLLVYSFSPALREDEKSKVLCCFVACLTIAYTSLSLVQLTGSVLSSTICFLVAISIQFSFLASFFWLNVLCYHTWRKLRDVKHVGREGGRRNRFRYYSLYAWTMPILFVVITLTMDMTPALPNSHLKPDIGLDSCWFKEDSPAALPYFYAPMSCILVVNLILFILSAVSVHRNHPKTTAQLRMTSMRQVVTATIQHRRKIVFLECLFLFLVMGLNWAFEVIAWAAGGPPQLWFCTDIFNTLQGVTVFYAFVFREDRAKNALKSILTCSPFTIYLTKRRNGNHQHNCEYSPAPSSISIQK